ncbi:MAG: hypothetical protein QXE66_05330 [Desulfurococcaceae archaeon]
MVEKIVPFEITCPKCGYTWFTKGRLKYITCPNCHYKIRNPYYIERRNKEEKNEGFE